MTSANLVMQEMDEAIEDLYAVVKSCHWTDRKFYVNWLAQTFFYVSQTTRLLALAASRAPLEENDLHQRLIDDAAKEEKGHEKLLLHDLKMLGQNIKDFQELPQTAFFYQTLYYLVDNEGPASIFGYALLLEGLTAKRLGETLAVVKEAHGSNASTFLKVHCEVDVHHFGLSMDTMKKCSPEQLGFIRKALQQCRVIYGDMLRTIQAQTAQEVRSPVTRNGADTMAEL